MTLRFLICFVLFSIVLCDLPPMNNEKDVMEYLSKVEAGTETLDPLLIQKVRIESYHLIGIVC